MKQIIRSAFNSLGLEVRRTSQVAAAIDREKQQREIKKWEIVRAYGPSVILDIGANDGYSARMFRQLMPDVTIYSFEPLADCFAQVDAILKENPPGKAFHFALGEREEETTIHRSEFSPSSSLLEMGELHKSEFPYTANETTETVQVRRLDDIEEDLGLAKPFIVKIDVQGFEDRVIRGGKSVIKKASAVVVELSSFELYEGQPTFDDVNGQLRELGFVFRGCVDQMLSKKDGRVLQFDGLFENPEHCPRQES